MVSTNLFLFSFKKSILSNLYTSYVPFIHSQGCEFLPNLKDNLKTRNYKKINMLFMNIVHNGQYKEILKANDLKRSKAHFYKFALINLQYDILQAKHFIKQLEKARVKYLKDDNDYTLINKRMHYRDLSVRGILKALNQKSKLSDFSYARALKNLADNKPLSPKTKMLINRFLKTIKASHSKNTLRAMNQQNRRTISVKCNRQKYNVVLKKSSRRGYLPALLDEEFKTRLSTSYILDNLKNSVISTDI